MRHLTVEQAHRFAQEWLPAWTGNDPVRLASFYAEDTFYLDPAVPQGLTGKSALLAYFERLLAKNPRWVWKQTQAIPMLDGFVNKWRAEIPVGADLLTCDGVCLVQLDDRRLIRRNEVYFDRSQLLLRAVRPHESPRR